MSNLRELLKNTADRVADYRGPLSRRRVAPVADLERLRAELGGLLPAEGADAGTVLDELAAVIHAPDLTTVHRGSARTVPRCMHVLP